MAKSQQTFNKIEKEKKRLKKREDKRKKMEARKAEQKENGTKGDFKKKFNNAVRFAYDNFDPEMVVLLFKTIMTDYQIRFNIRTDLDKDVYKVFSERYTKYIV